jgi:shikimate dehydrogenase
MTEHKLQAGVIGWPISHSLSPYLHGFWLNQFGINGQYDAYPVKADNVIQFIKDLDQHNLQGVNVTVPHKETVMAACDIISNQARRIGAVNTIICQSDGLILGDNSDAYGFLMNLTQSEVWPPKSLHRAVVLGAGGAARAVIVALQDIGFTEIYLVNRTVAKAKQLAQDLVGDGLSHIYPLAFNELSQHLSKADFLVNTTSLGMKGSDDLEIDLTNLKHNAIVSDIVYNPLETGLLRQAKARGNQTIDGIGMLLYQAIPGFMAWFSPAERPVVSNDLREFMLSKL